MYMIWCFVYLPINIYYELIVYNFSLVLTVFDLIRGWLLVCENPYSWPLWYLLASAVAVLLIYIFRKFKFSFSIILLCSLVLSVIGYCYTTYHDALYNLNPFSHLDPIGTLMLVFAGFGWGKPVHVNTRKLY